MFTLWLEFFLFFSFSSYSISTRCSSLPSIDPHTHSFLPVASFNSSTRHRPKPLPSTNNTDPSPCPAPTQAPTQHWQCQLISSFSAPISLLSHFSSTLSFNLSPSQTLRPMIASAGFWFCRRDWQNNVVAVTRFYVDVFYFDFDEWVLILLMVDEWWLGFSGFMVAFG